MSCTVEYSNNRQCLPSKGEDTGLGSVCADYKLHLYIRPGYFFTPSVKRTNKLYYFNIVFILSVTY